MSNCCEEELKTSRGRRPSNRTDAGNQTEKEREKAIRQTSSENEALLIVEGTEGAV